MKSMNRRDSKKIAVMAAIIMGLMVFAFMPMASAGVTSFTVTPSTGLAGAVDSYNALVTTDGVTTINITIPAGFLAVEPMTGGVEIARVDFWNTSTRDYYGYGTVTANNANPSGKVDVYCKMRVGGEEVEYGPTPQVVDYNPSATSTFLVEYPEEAPVSTATVTLTLPTEKANGSINITIDCSSLDFLEDVHIAIRQFVRNPTTAGDYDFIADGVTETVKIIATPGGRCTVFRAGGWYVDTNGDLGADIYFNLGLAGDIPIVGDITGNGYTDVAVVRDVSGGLLWYIDTDGNYIPDQWVFYGLADDIPMVGDMDGNGSSDRAVVRTVDGNLLWYIDTNLDGIADQWVFYGLADDIPMVGDMDGDGSSDRAVVRNVGGNLLWYIDTNLDRVADMWIYYGHVGDIPLVGHIAGDWTSDRAVFRGNLWYVDLNLDCIPDKWIPYGLAGDTPLTGDIGY